MSCVIDEIECHECGNFIPTTDAVADPMGNPLCKPCFNLQVMAGGKEDVEDMK